MVTAGSFSDCEKARNLIEVNTVREQSGENYKFALSVNYCS